MHAPLRRIAKHLNISPKTLYDKIDFIHRQCLSFFKERELRLIEGKLKLDRLYLSTGRQVQTTPVEPRVFTQRVALSDQDMLRLYGVFLIKLIFSVSYFFQPFANCIVNFTNFTSA